MFEAKIDYPCAIVDPTEDGIATALKWLNQKLKPNQQLTICGPTQKSLLSYRGLRRIFNTTNVNIETLRAGFFNAYGPLLAVSPTADTIAEFTSSTGITALAVAQWHNELSTWATEVNAEIIYTNDSPERQHSSSYEIEPALSPEVINTLQKLTEDINHNNTIVSMGAEKYDVVKALLRLHDTGHTLPAKRMTEWAAAHGWRNDNPKYLGNFARSISAGVRPKI